MHGKGCLHRVSIQSNVSRLVLTGSSKSVSKSRSLGVLCGVQSWAVTGGRPAARSGPPNNGADSAAGHRAVSDRQTDSSGTQAQTTSYSSSLIEELAVQFADSSTSDSCTATQSEAPVTRDATMSSTTRNVVVPSTCRQHSPLSWFGVLVSPDLRKAETDFCKAVQSAIELAQARSRLTQCVKQVQERSEHVRLAKHKTERSPSGSQDSTT